MNAQEQQLIDELVDRIRNTNVQDKDVAAEQHLQQGLANAPDALYILAQTVIVQKYGMEQAQARMASMQSELDTLRQQVAQAAAHPSGGSFLSHIFGGGSGSSQQAPQAPPAQPSQGSWQSVNSPVYPSSGAAPPPAAYPAPGYGQPGYGGGGGGFGGGGFGGGGGGFLQGALQTAAGVAMGEMAVESMESLFHGFGGGGGYGGRGFEGGQPSETIINNYNDGNEPRHDGSEHSESSRDRDDSSFYNPSDDASRDSDKGSSFADTGSDSNDNTDSNQGEDSGDDGSNFDSGDDGGSGGGDDSNY